MTLPPEPGMKGKGKTVGLPAQHPEDNGRLRASLPIDGRLAAGDGIIREGLTVTRVEARGQVGGLVFT